MPKPQSDWLTEARLLKEEALGAIYDAYHAELHRYAYRLLGSEQDAEDLVAETFYRFLRALSAGGGPRDHLRAYLYRVTHNLAMDRHRRGHNRELAYSKEQEALMAEDNPAVEAERSIQQEEARAALWRLTPEQRQVIALKFFQGFNNEEVAEVLEKPVGAVKSLQHRALNALRRMLLPASEDLEII